LLKRGASSSACGQAWCAEVQTCCADRWDAYHEAAQAFLPNAPLVVDRFQVMKNLNAALTTARRAIQKQADVPTQEVLKGSRWLWVKNREQLSAEDQAKLQKVLQASPILKECYDLKEAFRELFKQSLSREVADQKLTDWLRQVEATGLHALKSFVKTVMNWRASILNYFHGRYSNGFAEGVNLKIKLINRRAFGYTNFENFRLHVLVAFNPCSR
jgi:transposase